MNACQRVQALPIAVVVRIAQAETLIETDFSFCIAGSK
jgi:hypothetical protein